jgi:transposase
MASRRRYSVELKLSAVRRMAEGESPSRVAADLGIAGRRLYEWHWQYQEGGAEAFRSPGRPRKEEALTARGRSWRRGEDELSAAQRQLAELQRKIGEQQGDLDFFRKALRRVKEIRQPPAERGTLSSIKSSKR